MIHAFKSVETHPVWLEVAVHSIAGTRMFPPEEILKKGAGGGAQWRNRAAG